MTSTTYNSLENIVNHMVSHFNENIDKQPSKHDLDYTGRLDKINHISIDNGLMDESRTETYILTWKILGSINYDGELLEKANLEVLEYLRIILDNLLIRGIHQMHKDLELGPLKEITLKGGSYNKILHDTDGSYLYLIKYSDQYIYITLTSSGY